MSSQSLPPPQLVATQDGLDALVRALATAPAIAVDTESNSMFAYRERVCLIQISTADEDFIVDPLAIPDVDALASAFANPVQEKVLHAAENDVVCLNRDFGFTFERIFDTMTAARTLGWPQVGLASILDAQFGVTLNKKYQRADWGKRPLTPEMLDYARHDTRYLLALRDRLDGALGEAGYRDEAQEEFERLTRLRSDPAATAPDPLAFWRVRGAFELSPPQAAALKALFEWREAQAARANRPPFKIMSEASLLAMAKLRPSNLDDLKRIAGLSPLQVQRYGRTLLTTIRQGLRETPPERPRGDRDPDDVKDRYERLHAWRKARAKQRGVESDVIVPRSVLRDLALNPPRTPDDLHAVVDLGPSRRRAYGDELLALLSGAAPSVATGQRPDEEPRS